MPLHEANKAEFDSLHSRIFDGIRTDHEARWKETVGGFVALCQPEFGMFVMTGPHGGSLRGSIGWVAQVRRKQGQFGSDNYILCHPGNEGWLMQHSNNVFYPLTPEETQLVRPFFSDCLPENADFSAGITLGSEETRAVGFMIEPPEGFETRGGEGARMQLTTIDADGSKTVTDTVFI